MTGIMWTAVAGVGFGLFQTLNRRAGPGMDAYLAPLLVGQYLERVTARVWLGVALIVGRSLLLILFR